MFDIEAIADLEGALEALADQSASRASDEQTCEVLRRLKAVADRVAGLQAGSGQGADGGAARPRGGGRDARRLRGRASCAGTSSSPEQRSPPGRTVSGSHGGGRRAPRG